MESNDPKVKNTDERPAQVANDIVYNGQAQKEAQ